MKATTGLLALGLFTLAGIVTVSCGGSSDDGDTDNTAGSSSAGKGTGGGSSGSSSTAGKTSSAGSSNSGGSTATAGTNGNNGGRNNQGGNFPGAGGAFNVDECGDGVIDGMSCEPAQGTANACQIDDTTYCLCQGRNNPTWVCTDVTGGQGGADGGGPFGTLTCPASAKTGDDCTGVGACPGSTTCFCAVGTVYCTGQQQ
ncbi:MAG TPA: hypothetical protein VHP33_22260 [Polyangiaceae bacterium]|nr:hypothetical protein [Polyangiaceae bacterium]